MNKRTRDPSVRPALKGFNRAIDIQSYGGIDQFEEGYTRIQLPNATLLLAFSVSHLM
jgi:hypothetical protein